MTSQELCGTLGGSQGLSRPLRILNGFHETLTNSQELPRKLSGELRELSQTLSGNLRNSLGNPQLAGTFRIGFNDPQEALRSPLRTSKDLSGPPGGRQELPNAIRISWELSRPWNAFENPRKLLKSQRALKSSHGSLGPPNLAPKDMGIRRAQPFLILIWSSP